MVKRKRTVTKAVCTLCGQSISKRMSKNHFSECNKKSKIINGKGEKPAFIIRIQDRYRPYFWMQLLIREDTLLSNLDSFLRDTWLECCGHLSEFKFEFDQYSENGKLYLFQGEPVFFDEDEINEALDEGKDFLKDIIEKFMEFYESTNEKMESDDLVVSNAVYELQKILSLLFDDLITLKKEMDISELDKLLTVGALLASLLGQEMDFVDDDSPDFIDEMLKYDTRENSVDTITTLEVEVKKLFNVGDKIIHTYDFGSSTNLTIEIFEMVYVPASVDPITLLLRNETPIFYCGECSEVAEYYCGFCGSIYACESCAQDHPDEMIDLDDCSNSPRSGVCGYI